MPSLMPYDLQMHISRHFFFTGSKSIPPLEGEYVQRSSKGKVRYFQKPNRLKPTISQFAINLQRVIKYAESNQASDSQRQVIIGSLS